MKFVSGLKKLGYTNIFVFMTVIVGLLFYCKHSNCLKFVNDTSIEGMSINKDITRNSNKLRCPNLLIQKIKELYLYNTKLTEIPGVNPIKFNNLEDYNTFLDWQKSQGIRCPVLYLQKTYTTQGESVYKIRPSAQDPQGGTEPSVLSADGETVVRSTLGDDITFAYPYSEDVLNKEAQSFAESDYEAEQNELDFSNVSLNPMDSNWGGSEYTKELMNFT